MGSCQGDSYYGALAMLGISDVVVLMRINLVHIVENTF